MADLFDRFDPNGLELPDRLVMAPMTRTRAGDGRVPTALMGEYYAQRASAGLIVTKCSAVREDSAGTMRAPGVHSAAQVEGWRPVTDAVHRADERIDLQIRHGGRIPHPSPQPHGEPLIVPSAILGSGEAFTVEGPKPYPVPRALALGEIAPLVEAFGSVTVNARAAGLDGVELHGAFGCLPNRFLQDGTSTRDDAHGSSIANRARFLLEVVEATAGAWAPERASVEASPSARLYGQIDRDAPATFSHRTRALDAMQIGSLRLVEPNAGDLRTGSVQTEQVTGVLRPLFRGAAITDGGHDKPKADAILAQGLADLVSFGAPCVADPDLAGHRRQDAVLDTPDPSLFHGEEAHGCTDCPELAA